MSRIISLETDIAVAPQLVETDFANIAARGFRSIVNNRPDGEAPDQLTSAQAERIALRHGLVFRAQAVTNCSVTDDDVVSAFDQLMRDLPRPILFYCRSGTRCAILWAQAAAVRLGVDRVLAAAEEAGFDLEILRDTLNERLSAPIDVLAQQEKDVPCSLEDARRAAPAPPIADRCHPGRRLHDNLPINRRNLCESAFLKTQRN